MSEEEPREPDREPLGRFLLRQLVIVTATLAVVAIQTGHGRDQLRRAGEWGRYGLSWLAWKGRQIRRHIR